MIVGWQRILVFMYFIYAPIFTINLASKKNRPKLRAIHSNYHSVLYFNFVNQGCLSL